MFALLLLLCALLPTSSTGAVYLYGGGQTSNKLGQKINRDLQRRCYGLCRQDEKNWYGVFDEKSGCQCQTEREHDATIQKQVSELCNDLCQGQDKGRYRWTGRYDVDRGCACKNQYVPHDVVYTDASQSQQHVGLKGPLGGPYTTLSASNKK